MTIRRLPGTLAALIGLTGAGLLGAGLWIPTKAEAAGLLLRRAWDRTLAGGEPARPWPWAETWPVGRLMVPDAGVDLVVLAGAEGASLAFAPGHVDGTAAPGQPGNVVLAGHRDTTFRFLRRLEPGAAIELEDPRGGTTRFVVSEVRIVHESDVGVLAPTPEPSLTLVTCYPFDTVRPGGPLRYVVRALADDGRGFGLLSPTRRSRG